jgi:hypothetical protein
LQARTTSLTFITVSNSHFLTHTSVVPWPHIFDIRAYKLKRFYKKKKKIKNLYRTRQLKFYYHETISKTADTYIV